MSEEFEELVRLVSELQGIMSERHHKREPFLSSFADGLKNVVNKAREWFNEEATLADSSIGILEQLIPFENFNEDRSKLHELIKEFDKTLQEFDKIIESMKSGEIKSVRQLAKEGVMGIGNPEFIKNFSELVNLTIKLEDLIDSLEQRARYITYPLRLIQSFPRRES